MHMGLNMITPSLTVGVMPVFLCLFFLQNLSPEFRFIFTVKGILVPSIAQCFHKCGKVTD